MAWVPLKTLKDKCTEARCPAGQGGGKYVGDRGHVKKRAVSSPYLIMATSQIYKNT
jgi:hypothetical protein